MPTRVLREGILSSPRINALSPMAELFYRRLMTVADDYGRYYASPATMRGACWPTCPDRVTDKQVAGWLDECLAGDNPLIIKYTSGGNHYIQVQNFGQQTRSKSKFPEPTENNMLSSCESDDKQMTITCESPVQPSRSRSRSRSRFFVVGDVAAPSVAVFDWFETQFWPSWVKAKNDSKGAAVKSANSKARTDEVRAEIMAAITRQRDLRISQDPQYRSHAATWLNQGRWVDDIVPAPPAKAEDPELKDYRNRPWKREDWEK